MGTVTGKSAAGPAEGAGSDSARASLVFGAWDRLSQRVLRFRFALVVIVAVVIVAAGQLAEDLADSPPLQMGPPTFLVPRWTVVLATLYMLVMLHVVDRTVEHSLPSLQRIVRIDAESFRAYALRMRPARMRTNVALFGLEALVVTLVFLVLGTDLPTRDPVTNQPVYLPVAALGALVVLVGYTVVGWGVQTMVNVTIRRGRALGELSREPFEIDVFDTSNILPFGNIALAVSLAPAGVIFILLLGLGQPSSWLSWTILLLAGLASVLALLLPLRGIHHQMVNAKQAALATLNGRISEAYDEATGPPIAAAQLGSLNERTNTLIPLRRTVQEMTTWPFRNTVAFGRAILIASAPLIYTALSELIRVFWISPLSR